MKVEEENQEDNSKVSEIEGWIYQVLVISLNYANVHVNRVTCLYLYT